MSSPLPDAPGRVLYVRAPGLLAAAARATHPDLPVTAPIAVAEGRLIRDACPLALARGVDVGGPLTRARRICPELLVESANTRWTPEHHASLASLSKDSLLAPLADASPTVEPDGPDIAYADLTGCPARDLTTCRNRLTEVLGGLVGIAPRLGIGPSKNAARALAECSLPPGRLADADAHYLWPEDPVITSRLHRLDLTTYGAVAAMGEAALVYQFGAKVGTRLYRRSWGRDLIPVRPLWPPPQVDVRLSFPLDPITGEGHLARALGDLAAEAGAQLRRLGRHARRLLLSVETERSGRMRAVAAAEWVLPAPVQSEADVGAAVRRLRAQVTISAPVTGLALLVADLDLPPAATGDLFDTREGEKAARRIAIAAERQKLRARYGVQALLTLGEIPIPRREVRRGLRRERLRGQPGK